MACWTAQLSASLSSNVLSPASCLSFPEAGGAHLEYHGHPNSCTWPERQPRSRITRYHWSAVYRRTSAMGNKDVFSTPTHTNARMG